MKKFTAWLEANRGMATTIAKSLGISVTNITNAKNGRLLMPGGWMPTIVKLAKRKLTYEDLVLEREFHRARKEQERFHKKALSQKTNT